MMITIITMITANINNPITPAALKIEPTDGLSLVSAVLFSSGVSSSSRDELSSAGTSSSAVLFPGASSSGISSSSGLVSLTGGSSSQIPDQIVSEPILEPKTKPEPERPMLRPKPVHTDVKHGKLGSPDNKNIGKDPPIKVNWEDFEDRDKK
jgi:hypothetical protein